MNIMFYDTKPYDRSSFDAIKAQYPELSIDYTEEDLSPATALLAQDHDAVCAFVTSDLGTPTLDVLAAKGIKLILMRCAGFNNVALETAKAHGMTVLRVPGYSPEAIAEHAMALALAASRRLRSSFARVKQNNFSLVGLTGINFFGKTAGIIGTGKIGSAFAKIVRGFGMKVIAYDPYPNTSLDFVTYLSLDEVLAQSDLISIHSPLSKENYHLIDAKAIAKMKDGVIFVNTARGGLVATSDLIEAIRAHKFTGVGLDVYEEETDNVYENRENEIMADATVPVLLSFPNVVLTSHQAFLTEEALASISKTTLDNARAYLHDEVSPAVKVA